MIKIFRTRTGAICCDTDKTLEYLYVGDYGKENNIKADFLGYNKEINSVPHKTVDLKDKMVKLAMVDVRTGLCIALEAMKKLRDVGVLEDNNPYKE